MKILQLISSAGFFGVENVALGLSMELKAQNIWNVLGVFGNYHNLHLEIIEEAKKNDLGTHIFYCNGRFDIKTMYNMINFIKNNKVDIIHTHGSKPNFYGFVVAKLLKVPIVATCHGRIENPIVSVSNSWAGKISNKKYYRIDKTILPRFGKVIAVSEDIKDEFLRNGVIEGRIGLIYNGVAINKYGAATETIRKELNIDKETKVIGTVARLTAEKGLPFLLEAFEKVLRVLPDSTLIIVGNGPLGDELKEKACELGIAAKVIFTGKRNDLPQIYSTMDIFVLPSLKEELPMVILEAMASKKPIIATNVGAIPKLIENGREGFLVGPGRTDDLTRAIIAMAKDIGMEKKFAENAYKKVVEEFSSEKMCRRYVDAYKEVMQQKGKSTN